MLRGYERRALCEQLSTSSTTKDRPQAAQNGHTLYCTYACTFPAPPQHMFSLSRGTQTLRQCAVLLPTLADDVKQGTKVQISKLNQVFYSCHFLPQPFVSCAPFPFRPSYPEFRPSNLAFCPSSLEFQPSYLAHQSTACDNARQAHMSAHLCKRNESFYQVSLSVNSFHT